MKILLPVKMRLLILFFILLECNAFCYREIPRGNHDILYNQKEISCFDCEQSHCVVHSISDRKVSVISMNNETSSACMIREVRSILTKKNDNRPLKNRIFAKFTPDVLYRLTEKCEYFVFYATFDDMMFPVMMIIFILFIICIHKCIPKSDKDRNPTKNFHSRSDSDSDFDFDSDSDSD